MLPDRRALPAILAVLAAVVALVLPAGLSAPAPQAAVQVAAVLAAALVLALLVTRGDRTLLLPIPRTGPPPAAQQRRRGDFLRQSNPDTPGRPRPRAPGAARA
ncbi:DUF6412 domain-containing protein [Nocardia sp. NPDC057353]|uniref:DUF6412 domain-containing protein n=1 Tax=Nocardia sp. NPDC057353 TaxID=3346104 RepID=UPI00362E1AFB